MTGVSDQEPSWPRRPLLESFTSGDAVFVRGVISEGSGTSLLFGEAYVGVMKRGLTGPTESGSCPVSCVTRADAYAPADELAGVKARLDQVEAELTAIREAIEGGPGALEAIRTILNPPPAEEEDGW